MKNFHTLILAIILLPLSVFAQDAEKFAAKTAVVDVESILEHSTAVAHIKKSINEISERIQAELSEKEQRLKADEAELIEKRGKITKDEFEKQIAEFNKKVSLVQQEMQRKKAKLEQAHAAAIAEVHKNTIAVISELSKKYGFNIVFPSAQVLFVDNELNITLEVISNLNERLEAVEVKYSFD